MALHSIQPGAPWPLVGREQELNDIAHALRKAGGSGAVIAGPPGVGRTRLASEALRRAGRRGARTWWVTATRAAASIPFSSVTPLFPDLLSAPSDRLGVIRASAAALRAEAGGRPAVVGVDDAHLLDDASAALLHHLVVSGAASAVMTLTAGQPAPDAVTALWKEHVLTRLDLEPLDEPATAALLGRVLCGQVDSGLAHELWQATGGNLLFMRELTREAARNGSLVIAGGLWRRNGPVTRLSARLRDLLMTRLREAPSDVLGVIEMVSFAEPVGPGLLARAGIDHDALECAEAQGWLAVTTDRRRRQVRLAHPLYGELLRSATSPLRAERVNRALAGAALELGLRRHDDVLRHAVWQLDGQGDPDPAALLHAAERAHAAFDHPLTLRLAHAAERAGGGFAATRWIAETLSWQGASMEADGWFARLEPLAGNDQERALATRGRAMNLAFGAGRLRDAERLVEETVPTIAEDQARLQLAGVTLAFALHRAWPVRAMAIALGLIRPSVSLRLRQEAVPATVIGLSLLGKVDQATRHGERSVSVGGDLAQPGAEVAYLIEMTAMATCTAHLGAGRVAAAEELARTHHRAALSSRADGLRAMWALARGAVELAAGRARSALRSLREAAGLLGADLPLLGPAGRVQCHARLAHAAALAGDGDAAGEALEQARAVPRDDLFVADLDIACAWEAACRGAVAEARATLTATAERCQHLGDRLGELRARHDLVRLGRPTDAAPRLAQLAREVEGEAATTFAAHAAAAAAGNGSELDRAAVALERMGFVLLAAEAAAGAAAAHRADGRAMSAAAAAEYCRRLWAACEGATTPALQRAALPEELSEREREIATLAAAGLSNRAIAERLHISHRTVENHLHRLFSKLGLRDRRQLTTVLAAHGARPARQR